MEVYASTTIAAPAGGVWKIMRNFVGLTQWSNVVTQAAIANGLAADQPGAIRRLEIADGSVFVETLVALSDVERRLSYDIVEGPLPVSNYLATMQVHSITENDTSFVSWGACFDTPPDQMDAMRDVVGQQICAGGLAALKAHLELAV